MEREGVFEEAIEGIKAAKAAGFMVCTNTTVYKETDMKEIESSVRVPGDDWVWTVT